MLAPGGRYVMIENCLEGLYRVNELRSVVNLPLIQPPHHNKYINEPNIDELVEAVGWDAIGISLESQGHHGSTYAVLSRVVNAVVAESEGKKPGYDSDINRLALTLPNVGDYGQYHHWVWRKSD